MKAERKAERKAARLAAKQAEQEIGISTPIETNPDLQEFKTELCYKSTFEYFCIKLHSKIRGRSRHSIYSRGSLRSCCWF